jgi:sec-independent protein translocase protein TatA
MSYLVPLAFLSGPPGGGEILIILLALLLLFGAKRLPQMARTLGKTLEEFRRASREVTDEIMRAQTDETPPTQLDQGTQPRDTFPPPAGTETPSHDGTDTETFPREHD